MRHFSGLLLALLMAASPALGIEAGSVAVVVVLDDSTGVKTATLKFKQGDKVFKEVQIESGREFKIRDLPEGKYRLVVEAGLHTTFVEEDVAIAADRGLEKKIRMAPAPFVIKDGPATKTILCSACHKAIYMEMIRGTGTDFFSGPWPDAAGKIVDLPGGKDYYSNSSRNVWLLSARLRSQRSPGNRKISRTPAAPAMHRP